MTDIVLVYPRTGFDIAKLSVDLPLSILAAASMVVEEFSVTLIDQRTEADWRNVLKKSLEREPTSVGISAMTGRQISYGLEVAQIVRDVSPKSKIIWGGVHPTLLPRQTLLSDYADIVVIGEGEQTLRTLMRALDDGSDLSNVNGIAYKENGKIIINEPAKSLDLNRLPQLPYHLLDMETYIGSQGRFVDSSARSLIFISSRGCPWQCAFCCNPKISKRRWRSIDADNVQQQVEDLVKKYNLNAITFHDEEFLVNKKRAESIADSIGGKVDWWIQARMDRLLEVDIDRLAAGGLRGVQPGIESGSDRILSAIRKGETVSQIRAANKKLAGTPITPLYNFMVGFPKESDEEIRMTVKLALDLIEDNSAAEISGVYVFVPYPGTELFELAVNDGFRPPTSLAQWSAYNRQHLDTPWIQGNRNLIENLVFTSKLIDGKRMARRARQMLPLAPLSDFAAGTLTGIVKKKWRDLDFRPSPSTAFIKWMGRRYLQ